MPGRPKQRLRTLEAKARDGKATDKDLSDIEKLKKRLEERSEVRAASGARYNPDSVEQLGGGLVVDLAPDDKLLVDLTKHDEISAEFFIDPKHGGGMIPYKRNFWQKELRNKIQANRAKGRWTRMMIVKGRQFGTTTGTADFILSEALAFPGINAIAVTYKKALERVLPIATTYRTFIESHPSFKDTPPEYYTVNNWKGANGSSIQFHIATPGLARGNHYRFIHGTEVDFWEDFDETITGMMPGLAKHWSSVAIFETTLGDRPSVGLRNLISAIKEGRQTEWELWFQEWWRFPDYHAGNPANSFAWDSSVEQHIMSTLTPKERDLVAIGVPYKALEWRRRVIMADFMGDEDKFAQEFPSTIEEALEFRGSWFFSRPALNWHKKNLKPCEQRMRVWCEDKDYFIAPYRPAGDSTKDPYLRVWEPPAPDRRYRIGADVAASEDLSAARSDLCVLDVDTGRVVARWWGQVPAHKFGQAIHATAMYYGGGNCEVMFDRTGVGAAVIGELERLNTPNVAKGTQNKIGFHFNADFKALLLGNLQQIIDSCSMSYYCDELHKQLSSFTGETKDAGWVDAVVSLALACYRLPESAQWIPALKPEDDDSISEARGNGPMTLAEMRELAREAETAGVGAREYLYDYT